MKVIEIPFVKKVGIEKDQAGHLTLGFDESIQNHLQTFHASALFTLAESASGVVLQDCFPDLVGRVIPVMRDAQIRYKKPAVKSITAFPTLSEESISKFREQLDRKKRSTITVEVTVKDSDDVIVCVGSFNWFVQIIDSLHA